MWGRPTSSPSFKERRDGACPPASSWAALSTILPGVFWKLVKMEIGETPGVRQAIRIAVLLPLVLGIACGEPTAPEPPLPLPLTDRIVFESDRADPLGDVYAMTFDGADVRRLTNSETGETCPRISPDGNRIAYFTRAQGDPVFELWLM